MLRVTSVRPCKSALSIQGQHPVTEIAHHLSEPTLQDLGLLPITAMADQFDTPAQFANRDRR